MNSKKAGNFILYLIFRFFLYLFAITPIWLLHGFSYIVFVYFFYIHRYRVGVSRTNLRNSFPEKDEDELRGIMVRFYRHFADILIEAIMAFWLTGDQVRKRYHVINPELLDSFYRQKKSVIIVMGHYNNWEWGCLAAPLFLKHKTVGLYLQLSNGYIDQYILRARSKSGLELVPVDNTFNAFNRPDESPTAFLMIADQRSVSPQKACWINFLHQETAVVHGPEKYARMKDYPVLYAFVKKEKRSFYSVEMKILTENPTSTRPGEISEMFMRELEMQIREKPEYWLWTHRRWKYPRPPHTAITE